MIWLLVALLAASFVARHGFLAGLLVLAFLPVLFLLAIPGFFVLAGTIVAFGG